MAPVKSHLRHFQNPSQLPRLVCLWSLYKWGIPWNKSSLVPLPDLWPVTGRAVAAFHRRQRRCRIRAEVGFFLGCLGRISMDSLEKDDYLQPSPWCAQIHCRSCSRRVCAPPEAIRSKSAHGDVMVPSQSRTALFNARSIANIVWSRKSLDILFLSERWQRDGEHVYPSPSGHGGGHLTLYSGPAGRSLSDFSELVTS